MDEYQSVKLEGAKIFRLAVEHINQHGWDHNSMNILLAVTPGERWPQPMAVLMFSELEHQLGGLTLSQFDRQTQDPRDITDLFNLVADSLTGDIIKP
jgi:hypothetical protein